MSQPAPDRRHPEEVERYLSRLYDENNRQYACRARTPEEFAAWQAPAREEFRRLLGIPRIAAGAAGHSPVIDIAADGEDMGAYTRRRGRIETEPDVWISFWLLRPKNEGPLPAALTPHGHENGDTYAGIAHDDRSRRQIEEEDQDVAVDRELYGERMIGIRSKQKEAGAKQGEAKSQATTSISCPVWLEFTRAGCVWTVSIRLRAA